MEVKGGLNFIIQRDALERLDDSHINGATADGPLQYDQVLCPHFADVIRLGLLVKQRAEKNK
ncbi:hypothetical protein PISMIDRAFT_323146 [Pisolithus microcarpus 441]|uniref:Uncharacterized protein n=1 Tax=Pisolithus microcarpus 441 TaxID=765257 RepID=A0A0C9YFR9_9AGAM|nr:hypothetical protein PISMIDRAFT_323146 [Pisolithus microcarpus 441]